MTGVTRATPTSGARRGKKEPTSEARRQKRPEWSGNVLLLDGEEGLVKKVEYGPDWIDLISINPEYAPRHFEKAEVLRLRVVGLVVGSYKKF